MKSGPEGRRGRRRSLRDVTARLAIDFVVRVVKGKLMINPEPEEGLADLARESAQHAEEAAKEAHAAAESADEVARSIDPEGQGHSAPTMPTESDAGGHSPEWVGDGGGSGDNDPAAGTDFSGGGYGGGPQGP
jgi:hypothetical protein